MNVIERQLLINENVAYLLDIPAAYTDVRASSGFSRDAQTSSLQTELVHSRSRPTDRQMEAIPIGLPTSRNPSDESSWSIDARMYDSLR